MNWLRDSTWQQGVAIVLVIIGATLIYRTVQDATAALLPGVLLFSAGIALPLVSQAFRARGEKRPHSDEVP